MKFQRVLFKISGESMMGDKQFGHDLEAIKKISKEIEKIYKLGIQIALVVGGGNICRGVSVSNEFMDRASADQMGMLATIMNGIALQSALEKLGIPTRMQSALKIDNVCEPYIRRRAIRHLEKGRVVIFVAGTGNPFFTTDTASVLRASEVNCDAIFKGTQVDGVYDKDPKKFDDAKRYDKITYDEVIQKNLKVMDPTAFTLARDTNLPIVVFKISEEDSILNVINGVGKYTLISNNL
ncbi:MAG: UMP kinase [Rickettsiales bacterium]|nr:UMP kinase [Rickettsiales bacterium]